MWETGGRAPCRTAPRTSQQPGSRRSCAASVRPRARPAHAIPAPPFPRDLPWVNVAPLRMDQQRGRPVLVEFWDFCRVNSLRTLPYLKAWHERYAADGPARDRRPHRRLRARARPDAVRAAVERLGIEYPVVIDERLELWDFYGNEGWPARYLWDRDGALYSMHYGEGAYDETEREIQALLGVERELVAPRAPRGRARTCCCRPRPPTSPAPTPGPTRRAACGRCSRARGERARRTAARSRSTGPARTRSSSTPRHTAACSSSRSATA